MPARRLALPGCAAVLLAACGGGPDFGAPDTVTDQGLDALELWRGFHWTAVVVGVVVYGLIAWSVVRYRRRGDDLPGQTAHNIPLEVVYTVVPLVVVAVLFGFTVATQERSTALVDDPDLVVDVVGFQWGWEFRYPDEVVVAADADELPELVLPVGATVRLRLSTPDVVHSFWVPSFLTKRDLIPRVDNELDVSVVRAGEWAGVCAEFCGLEHYRMRFTVRAVEPPAFERWLAAERRRAEVAT